MTVSYPLGYRGIVIFSFIKVHVLRRFPSLEERPLNMHMSQVNVDE